MELGEMRLGEMLPNRSRQRRSPLLLVRARVTKNVDSGLEYYMTA